MIGQDKSQSDTSKTVSMCIDWISTTTHQQHDNFAYASYPALHDWENWRECVPKNGYKIGAIHTTGANAHINLDRIDMGIHTIYSGGTLRRIEHMYSISGFEVLKHHVESGHNIARVDIAIDYRNCGVKVQDFVDQWKLGQVVTKLRTAHIVKEVDGEGYTLYIGSQKTRKKLLKVYNKGAEQNTDDDWVRCELQLMGKPATKLCKLWLESDDDKEFLLKGVKDVIDFPMLSAWSQVFDGITPIKIGSQSTEKGDTRDWLLNQVIPSLAREIVLDASFWVQFAYMTQKEVDRLRGQNESVQDFIQRTKHS